MTLFNSEWIWLNLSSSPSCKLGAHGQGPLSFLLQGKPKDNPILRNTGFIISRCCVVHHPETMEDKHPPLFVPFLPGKDTHTHTCLDPDVISNNRQRIFAGRRPTLHLATCSAGHLLVAFFVFSVPFASLVPFCGYPDRTVLASRARGCCDEDDDDIDEMRSQR